MSQLIHFRDLGRSPSLLSAGAILGAAICILAVSNYLNSASPASYEDISTKIANSAPSCRVMLKHEITQIVLTHKKPITRGELAALGESEHICNQIDAQLKAAAES